MKIRRPFGQLTSLLWKRKLMLRSLASGKKQMKNRCKNVIENQGFQKKNRMSAPLPKKAEWKMDDFVTVEYREGSLCYGDVFLVREKKTSFLCVLKDVKLGGTLQLVCCARDRGNHQEKRTKTDGIKIFATCGQKSDI
jgi:hypothetical protein